MVRRLRDKDIESREARSKLKVSGKPYWSTIGKGLHVGCRKGQRGGVWVVRRYLGNQGYKVETIALADDREEANGIDVLDFWQAQERLSGAVGSSSLMVKARLHPIWAGGKAGYVYSVILDGGTLPRPRA
jgi:hypothetical protein